MLKVFIAKIRIGNTIPANEIIQMAIFYYKWLKASCLIYFWPFIWLKNKNTMLCGKAIGRVFIIIG